MSASVTKTATALLMNSRLRIWREAPAADKANGTTTMGCTAPVCSVEVDRVRQRNGLLSELGQSLFSSWMPLIQMF